MADTRPLFFWGLAYALLQAADRGVRGKAVAGDLRYRWQG